MTIAKTVTLRAGTVLLVEASNAALACYEDVSIEYNRARRAHQDARAEMEHHLAAGRVKEAAEMAPREVVFHWERASRHERYVGSYGDYARARDDAREAVLVDVGMAAPRKDL